MFAMDLLAKLDHQSHETHSIAGKEIDNHNSEYILKVSIKIMRPIQLLPKLYHQSQEIHSIA